MPRRQRRRKRGERAGPFKADGDFRFAVKRPDIHFDRGAPVVIKLHHRNRGGDDPRPTLVVGPGGDASLNPAGGNDARPGLPEVAPLGKLPHIMGDRDQVLFFLQGVGVRGHGGSLDAGQNAHDNGPQVHGHAGVFRLDAGGLAAHRCVPVPDINQVIGGPHDE